MNDFDLYLETELRVMLNPVVARRPPARRGRRKEAEQPPRPPPLACSKPEPLPSSREAGSQDSASSYLAEWTRRCELPTGSGCSPTLASAGSSPSTWSARGGPPAADGAISSSPPTRRCCSTP